MCVIRYRRRSGGTRRPNHFPGCLFRPQSPRVQSRPIGLAKQHTLTHSYAHKRFIHSQTDNTLKKGIEEAFVFLCTGVYIKWTFNQSTHLMCKTLGIGWWSDWKCLSLIYAGYTLTAQETYFSTAFTDVEFRLVMQRWEIISTPFKSTCVGRYVPLNKLFHSPASMVTN